MMGVESLLIRTAAPLVLSTVVLSDASLVARLRPETVTAWNAYRAGVESRRSQERADRGRFLALDFLPTRAGDRRAALAGDLVTRRFDRARSGAARVDVPSGRVHHWLGVVFIRGTSVSELLSRLEHDDPPAIQEDVLTSSVLSRAPGVLRTYLRLRRTKIVTAVYNTEHEVRFERIDQARGASTSVATKIAEVRHPGTPEEVELPPGDDRGFLWRLDAFWRYEAVPGGVLAECESISLSRDVPALIDYVAGRIIAGTARESMEKTLLALRDRYERR
jgi:hypothetical protein